MKSFRLITIVLAFVSISTSLNAGQITEQQARQVGKNFFFERVQSHKPTGYNELTIEEVFEIQSENQSLYYVMNFRDGGFIAIAATDAVYPVLCYSFNGRYETEGQPDNFQAWMMQYQGEVLKVIEEQLPAGDGVPQAWDHYLNTPARELRSFSGREVPPLLTSNWNQDKYYNEMCPADGAGPGGHCYAGCVATAMGQVMNYFRWPETGTGSYSYYCPPYDTLSADFANSNYRWDLMEPSLGHSNLELAEILYHLGVSVDMVYGPDGSGMYNHKAAYSLRTYFKYSPETQYVYRDSTTMDWDSLLVSHLDQRIPMYYAGWSVPNLYGHAFVCDGYQGTDYYHFNWGWGGSYDGYFYTDNLTPGGSNFNLAQELIIHAVPDTNLYTYPVNCQGSVAYSEMFGTLEDGSGPIYAYANGSDCNWLVAPDDSVNFITLSLLNFNLSSGDTLKIFDGDSTDAPLLAALTGDTIPGPINSTGKFLYITFNSDDTISEEGFLAYFESEIPVYCSGSTVLNAQTDTVSDGSGTYDYHNNSACTWIITPPGASTLTLYFTAFETEEGFDFLKVYDLGSSTLLAELTGTYPGGVPDPVTSPSGKMFLAFSTNYSGTADGWTAYYETDLVDIQENSRSGEVVIYPNPVKDVIYISFNEKAHSPGFIALSDLSGKVLIKYDYISDNPDPIQLDVSRLDPGMYLILIRDENKDMICRKVIVN